jgi:hypothetical protein
MDVVVDELVVVTVVVVVATLTRTHSTRVSAETTTDFVCVTYPVADAENVIVPGVTLGIEYVPAPPVVADFPEFAPSVIRTAILGRIPPDVASVTVPLTVKPVPPLVELVVVIVVWGIVVGVDVEVEDDPVGLPGVLPQAQPVSATTRIAHPERGIRTPSPLRTPG